MKLMKALLGATRALCGNAPPARPISKSPTGGLRAVKPPPWPSWPRLSTRPGNHWVDGAIAGSGGVARPIIISRILGGDPMGATQFNHGRQAEELIAGWPAARPDRSGRPKSTGATSCTRRCSTPAPLTAKSTAFRSTSTRGSGSGSANKAFADAGVPVPTNWDEFVADAPALAKAGQDPAGDGQPALAVLGRLRRDRDRDRRHRRLDQESTSTRTPMPPLAPNPPRSSKPRPMRASCAKARTCTTGTRRPTSSSPARPAARSWATGRRANSRLPIRSLARTTPACRALA